MTNRIRLGAALASSALVLLAAALIGQPETVPTIPPPAARACATEAAYAANALYVYEHAGAFWGAFWLDSSMTSPPQISDRERSACTAESVRAFCVEAMRAAAEYHACFDAARWRP